MILAPHARVSTCAGIMIRSHRTPAPVLSVLHTYPQVCPCYRSLLEVLCRSLRAPSLSLSLSPSSPPFPLSSSLLSLSLVVPPSLTAYPPGSEWLKSRGGGSE
eukprot:3218734-Rhodomonas_salina.1